MRVEVIIVNRGLLQATEEVKMYNLMEKCS